MADEAGGAMDWGLDTQLIHEGQDPDATGSVVVPIYPVSTFARARLDEKPPFGYSRNANPTRSVLEHLLATIEHGSAAYGFGSGMAAITAAAQLLSAGDHAVVSQDCYMGTFRLFTRNMRKFAVDSDFVDLTDLDALRQALRPTTRMVWLETPSNPGMRIVDMAAIAEIAHAAGAIVVADNTVASPYCQQPLDFGVDVVVHSTTKYIGGHSDLMGGAVVVKTAELAEQVADQQYTLGAIPSAFDCWLQIRGLKTLGVRMRQHQANAQAVAEWLTRHPKVARVNYPGLPDHPGHDLARRQMPGGFSGLLSFELAGGAPAALAAGEGTRIFALAPSLGGVESLIWVPSGAVDSNAVMSQQLAGAVWASNPGLVRLSVGIERVDDLIADLEQALSAA
jgi:cystathionine gamma-synthase